MILTQPTIQGSPPVENRKLTGLLEEALVDLLRLQAEADAVCRAASQGMSRIATGGMQALRPTLEEGCAGISRRLAAMGGTVPAMDARPSESIEPIESPRDGALNAYRPCFFRLGRALREARRVSDEATMAIVSRLIVRLEKHLWLFDLPLAEWRAVDWSSVNLFSLC